VTLALNKLAREGYIVREKDTSRAIRLTNKRME
jgi:Mn-dependent DtxR family transcriptional regulator